MQHLLAITKEEGELCVYSSGLNNYGQLGHGDLKNREELTKVRNPLMLILLSCSYELYSIFCFCIHLFECRFNSLTGRTSQRLKEVINSLVLSTKLAKSYSHVGVVIMDHSASLWNNRMLDTWKIYHAGHLSCTSPEEQFPTPKKIALL